MDPPLADGLFSERIARELFPIKDTRGGYDAGHVSASAPPNAFHVFRFTLKSL
jgi:hypothetical protein